MNTRELPSVLLSLALGACGDAEAPQGGSATEGGTSQTTSAATRSDGEPPTTGAETDVDASSGAASERCIAVENGHGLYLAGAVAMSPGQEICLAVAEGVAGFTVYGAAADGDFGIALLEAPSGERVIDDFLRASDKDVSSEILLFFTDTLETVRPATLATAVPQSSPYTLVPSVETGEWTLRLGVPVTADPPTSAVEVEIWARGVDSSEGPPTIDVNLWMVQGYADRAYAWDVVDEALVDVLGFAIGDRVDFDLDPSFAELSDDAEMYDAFRATGAGGPPALDSPALNIVLNDIPWSLGQSPGIPGVPMKAGTPRSGIIAELTREPRRDVVTIAHEVGHFAGLNHTSETEGFGFDALDDTPACHTDAIERCPDRNNLMFWSAGVLDEPSRELSPEQQMVLRGSTLYRGRATPVVDRDTRRTSPGPRLHGPGIAGRQEFPAWLRSVPKELRPHLLRTCPHTQLPRLPQTIGVYSDALARLALTPTVPAFVRSRARTLLESVDAASAMNEIREASRPRPPQLRAR